MTTEFKRVVAGQYRDASSGWSIVRDGPPTQKRDRADWLVKNATGTVMRVCQTKAEAEIAAHAALA